MSENDPPPSSTHGNPFPVGHGSIADDAPPPPPGTTTAPGLGTPPPVPSPLDPPRRKPRRSLRGLRTMLLAVLGISAVGAGIFGVAKALGSRHRSLPIEAKRLPMLTRSMSEEQVESAREKDAKVKEMLLTAEMGAAICGHATQNPAHTLLALGDGSSSGAKAFFKPKNLDDVQMLLECGSTMAHALDSPYVGHVQFEAGDRTHDVRVLQLDFDEMPSRAPYAKQQFSGMSGYCFHKSEESSLLDDTDKKPFKDKDKDKYADADKDCDASTFAALHEGKTWFFGQKSALDQLAHTLARPRGDLSSSLELLQDAADATDGMPRRYVRVRPGSTKLFLDGFCNFAQSKSAGKHDDFQKACFPEGEEQILDAIDARVRAAAYEMDPDYERAEALKANVILTARDADAARELEKDVQDFVRDWKSHVENNEGRLTRLANKDPQSLDERSFAAVVDAFVRAVKGAKVTRSGRNVKIAIKENLSSANKSELREIQEGGKTDAKRAAVADILRAILKNQELPEASVAVLIGEKWAAFLASSHTELGETDCRKIKSKLDDVPSSDLPSDAMAIASMVRKLDCSKKTEMVSTLRKCLLAANDGASFAQCKPIEEPSEKDFGSGKEKKKDSEKDKD